ncbi:uncharacterized protein LOC128736679 [Sabethes cyaneus]|uniref:uncharacterized protein LOC128736679 n=1 Tax=Sabethes cyaneus TaxID=53552 RepID=UPI00237E00EA|nr:uncharacterized protein LOC128736679 [Sabethes cyaneus]
MVHRSGHKKKLNLDAAEGDSPSPRVPQSSVSEQKAEQEAAKMKNAIVANIDALSVCFDAAYQEYNDFQNKIYLADPTRRNEFESKFVEFEELYEFTSIAIREMIESHEKSQNALKFPDSNHCQPSSSSVSQSVRITPTIVLQQAALPSFDGRYDQWFKFKQMFRDIADKCTGDSAATKLHFLDKALVGRAQGSFDQQIIRDNDYEGAWVSLAQQYENLPALISDTVLKLLNLKAMTNESFHQLKSLTDDVEKCVSSLEFHDLKMDKLSQAIITTLVSTKLDPDTRRIWESNVKRGQLPIYKEMISVLRNQQHVLERCENYKSIQKGRGGIPMARPVQLAAAKTHTAAIQKIDNCPVCEDNHLVEKCDTFKRLAVKERYDKARQIGLCFACLKRGHRTMNCKNSVKCTKCSRRHHLLLHPEEPASQEEKKCTVKETEKNSDEQLKNDTTVTNCLIPCDAAKPTKQVLLATAVVSVFDVNGEEHKCRVLLDSGAMANFVSKRLVDMLRLKKNYVNIPVTGVNGMKTVVKFSVHCKAKSNISDQEFCLDYLVVPRVTGALPASRVDVQGWPIPVGLHLADPRFYEPSRVDMLVGAEAFYDILLAGKVKMTENLPTLQESLLGWLVSGPVASSAVTPAVRSYHVTSVRDADKELVSILKKFWTVDNQICDSKIDDDLEQHFVETFTRNDEGRYVVRLPFRANAGTLGDSRRQAEKRFYQLEGRLDKNPELKNLYSAFIREYIELGHCKLLPNTAGSNEISYYMPHHCVIRPDSSTTKLRVVFDASSKSSSGTSLNDLLMIGPPAQDTLFDIVLRFRFYRYAFTADVPKMYRMILMDERDTKFQKILWREKKTDPLQEIELTTVTYGTAAAPFLATRALNQLAEDEKDDFPVASLAIKRSVYVDDVLTGASTLDEAKQLQADLIQLLRRGGFGLHKWCANDAALLNDIPAELQEKQLNFKTNEVNETIKTLGLLWDPVDDSFAFRVNPVESKYDNVTKRQVMSEIAKLFDPLGLLGPIIVIAKVIMQDLWREGLAWDEHLSNEQLIAWKRLRDELPKIASMRIPRLVNIHAASRYEIHGFSDASMKAYGSCIYLRNLKQDGSAELYLLCGKSRVTPIKETKREPGSVSNPAEMTMPRLELCAAKLLAEQVSAVLNALELEVSRVVLWSDSQIVLAWINNMKPDVAVFVRNRVSRIRELTNKYEWNYIPTKLNPSDLISRGMYPTELANNMLWWKGPAFLRSQETDLAVFCGAGISSCGSNNPTIEINGSDAVDDNCIMILERTTSQW